MINLLEAGRKLSFAISHRMNGMSKTSYYAIQEM